MFPTIIPSRVLGQQACHLKIQVGIIGCGRIAGGMDIPGVWLNQHPQRWWRSLIAIGSG